MSTRENYLKFLAEPVEKYDGRVSARVRHPKKWDFQNTSLSGDYIDLEKAIKEGRKVWIWSDHHFFHENVIKFTDRPYENALEMNNKLIQSYNDTVNEGDICIWAGDITFKGTGIFNDTIYPKFNKTYNILVAGNHDFNGKKIRNLNFDEVHLILELNLLSHKVSITHIPFFDENNDFINVHGHIHNGESEHKHQLNVSIEVLDFKPKILMDLLENHIKKS